MKIYLPFFKRYIGIYINCKIRFKKRGGNQVLGVSNKVDNRYCVFLDYDIPEETTVMKDLKGLQKNFGLGNCYVFKTGAGFHGIFTDLVTYQELQKIMGSSSCDKHYKYVSTLNDNRQWVLRVSEKKKGNKVIFYKVLPSFHERPLSYPHARYLLSQGVPEEYIQPLSAFYECEKEKLIMVKYKA